MKKIVGSLLAVLMVFSMVACASKVTRKLEGTVQNVMSYVEIQGKGDKMTRQIVTNVYDFKKMGATSEDQYKQIENKIQEITNAMPKFEGYTVKLEKMPSGIKQIIDIDFEKVNVKELVDKKLITTSGDISKGLSVKKTVDSFISQGLKEVK